MATTSQAGSVHTIFGIDSISGVIAAAVGDFAGDYDLHVLEDRYRDQLESLLPDGWTIHGDDVFRAVGAEDIEDRDELRAQAAEVDTDFSRDDMAGWLEKAQRDLVEAEQRTKELRARRDQLVRIALEGGMSGYRAAQVLGISETTVGKIRRAVLDAVERLGPAVEDGATPRADAVAEILAIGASGLDGPTAGRMLDDWRTVRAQYDRLSQEQRPGPIEALVDLFRS
jgi:hypothetical protein